MVVGCPCTSPCGWGRKKFERWHGLQQHKKERSGGMKESREEGNMKDRSGERANRRRAAGLLSLRGVVRCSLLAADWLNSSAAQVQKLQHFKVASSRGSKQPEVPLPSQGTRAPLVVVRRRDSIWARAASLSLPVDSSVRRWSVPFVFGID